MWHPGGGKERKSEDIHCKVLQGRPEFFLDLMGFEKNPRSPWSESIPFRSSECSFLGEPYLKALFFFEKQKKTYTECVVSFFFMFKWEKDGKGTLRIQAFCFAASLAPSSPRCSRQAASPLVRPTFEQWFAPKVSGLFRRLRRLRGNTKLLRCASV